LTFTLKYSYAILSTNEGEIIKEYTFFIDELGTPKPTNNGKQEYFIMCGCAIENGYREAAKAYADHIKFKYWGRTDIVFHSREIAKAQGDFSIFNGNPSLHSDFINDLVKFLNSVKFTALVAHVDLNEALKRRWNADKVLKEVTSCLIRHFVLLVVSREAKGRVVVESATDGQNKYFLRAFQRYLSPNSIPGVSYQQVQRDVTSLSFVTKKNHDIEEQIADLFAYPTKCKFLQEEKQVAYEKGSYEARMIQILERKLFAPNDNAHPTKKNLYKQLNPYCKFP